MRDSMVFYRSFYDAIRRLPDADFAKAMRALMEYGLNGLEPEGNGVEYTVFVMAKPQIDANYRRWKNGCKGGKPSGNQDRTKTEPSDNQCIPTAEPENNQCVPTAEPNVNVNVNDNDKKENTLKGVKEKRFTPPTLEDVIGYCQEKGYAIDAERFVDFYSSKGWMVGKNKMKDWKAAVRNWARQDKPSVRQPVKPKGTGFNNFQQRDTDYDAMVQAQVQQWIHEEGGE